MSKPIYGWHVIHKQTGLPYGFCMRQCGNNVLEESEVLTDFSNPEDFELVAVVLAGEVQ